MTLDELEKLKGNTQQAPTGAAWADLTEEELNAEILGPSTRVIDLPLETEDVPAIRKPSAGEQLLDCLLPPYPTDAEDLTEDAKAVALTSKATIPPFKCERGKVYTYEHLANGEIVQRDVTGRYSRMPETALEKRLQQRMHFPCVMRPVGATAQTQHDAHLGAVSA